MKPHIQTIGVRGIGMLKAVRFTSMAEMASAADYINAAHVRHCTTVGVNWSHCSAARNGWSGAIDEARNGNESMGAQTAQLLAQLPELLSVQQRWVNQPAGGVPDVARFCANRPDAMRMRRPTMHQHSPLSVVVCVNSSAGCTDDSLALRGAALLAMVSSLSTIRPVILTTVTCWEYGSGGVGACVIDIGTSPLDLSIAGAALGSQRVIRGLMYGMGGYAIGQSVGTLPWPFAINPKEEESVTKFETLMRHIVGLDEDEPAILIAGAHVRHPSVNNPVKWLADMMEKYGAREALAA